VLATHLGVNVSQIIIRHRCRVTGSVIHALCPVVTVNAPVNLFVFRAWAVLFGHIPGKRIAVGINSAEIRRNRMR
jgi:hypothetical protein